MKYFGAILLFIGLNSFAALPYKMNYTPTGWQFHFVESHKTFQMNPTRFDGTNSDAIDVNGLGVVGLHAHMLIAPHKSENLEPIFIPTKEIEVRRDGIPESYFQVNNTTGNYVLLDKNFYQKQMVKEGAFSFALYSTNDVIPNPDVETIKKTIHFFVQTFPKRASQLTGVQIISLLNRDEKFDNLQPDFGSGFNEDRMIMLTSYDGNETLTHRYHEVGSLFKINSVYGHSLTWFIAFDQELKNTPVALLHDKTCLRLNKRIKNLNNAGSAADHAHTVDWFMEDVTKRNGYSLYAWGAAAFWQKINDELVLQNLPTIYDLIRALHKEEPPLSFEHPTAMLPELVSAYKRFFGKNKVFQSLVQSYFQEKTISDLIAESQKEKSDLGCK